MTPLARRLKKNQLRYSDWASGVSFQNDVSSSVLERIDDFHFFEATEVLPLIKKMVNGPFEDENGDLQLSLQAMVWNGHLSAILPAPMTFIEQQWSDDIRFAFLVVENEANGIIKNCQMADVYRFAGFNKNPTGMPSKYGFDFSHIGEIPLSVCSATPEERRKIVVNGDQVMARREHGWMLEMVYAALSLINSPKVVQLRQRPFHKGLLREVGRRQGWQAKKKLRAWSEIVLEPDAICYVDEDDEYENCEEDDVRLKKRRHFVRQHIRIKNHKVEIVRCHWRGDAAKGVVKSRYRLTPSQKAERSAAA